MVTYLGRSKYKGYHSLPERALLRSIVVLMRYRGTDFSNRSNYHGFEQPKFRPHLVDQQKNIHHTRRVAVIPRRSGA